MKRPAWETKPPACSAQNSVEFCDVGYSGSAKRPVRDPGGILGSMGPWGAQGAARGRGLPCASPGEQGVLGVPQAPRFAASEFWHPLREHELAVRRPGGEKHEHQAGEDSGA
eukprot:5221370-Pyramimonas_sp.AAC.1